MKAQTIPKCFYWLTFLFGIEAPWKISFSDEFILIRSMSNLIQADQFYYYITFSR